MKNSSVLVFIVLFLSGCTAIATQHNLMSRMGTYTFNTTPDVVYAGAVKMFNQDRIPLTSTGHNKGVSHWKKVYVSQGSLSHYEKIRFAVETTPVGKNKSIIRIYKESIPIKKQSVYIGKTLGDEIIKPERIRSIPFEYRVLKIVNPTAANRIEARAAR